jgi:two-component system, LytTR family, response regulator
MGISYKCLIVDDEKPAHMVIASHLKNCVDVELAGSAFNGRDAIQLLMEKEFDIVFLDIDMPLISGLEVLQTLPQRPATIITTAFNQFAFDAYQHDAVDYLLKPISLPRFLKSVEKAKIFCQNGQNKKAHKKKIEFRIKGETKELAIEHIHYIQSVGNYLRVFFYNNKSLDKPRSELVYETLKNVLANTDAGLFLQTHKSYIINRNFIERVNKGTITLKGNITIPLGRKYELLVSKAIG